MARSGRFFAKALHGDGVVGADTAPVLQQTLHNIDGRRVAEVVGVGFEGEAEQADGAPFENLQLLEELFHHAQALVLVDFACRRGNGHGEAVFGGGGDQGRGIFGEAGSAPAKPGLQEAGADALVEADAAGYLADVGADACRPGCRPR